MTSARTVTFRTSIDTDGRLDQLAKATDRSKSWHVEQAVQGYLDLQSWQIAEVHKGLEDVAAGRLVDHDAVGKWLKSWGKKTESDAPL